MTKIITPTALKSNKKSNYFVIGIKKARTFLFRLSSYYKDFKTKLITLRKFHELTWALNLTYTLSLI